MSINDAHCHFFSTPFFAALGRQLADVDQHAPHQAALARVGWDPPGSADDLADRWVHELDHAGIGRAALIASVPGDGVSVAAAVRRHPRCFVGCFMVDATQAGAAVAAAEALDEGALRVMCLFPAMHRFAIHDDRVRQLFEVAAARPGTAIFIHCGVLTVGIRAKLGLPSRFDLSLGNPMHIHPIAAAYPSVPVIVPHFGAGLFREALMLTDLCPNVYLDTSSSNSWIKYHPGLTLQAVFERALDVVGPPRLLFGTDSSFFPRGWVKDVYVEQAGVLDELGVSTTDREQIFGGNFDRLFPIS